MPEIISNAGAAGTDEAVVAPSTSALQVPTPEERIARAAALIPDAPQAPAAPAPKPWMQPAPASDKQADPPLADIIRAQREARQQAQVETQRRTSLEGELKAAREELARIRADRDAFEEDPVGYAKNRKWSPEQQLLYGKSLLFDLAPEKADPDFRYKMFEDRQKRQEAEKVRAQQEAEAQAQQEGVQRQVQEFYQDTASAVRGFESGSYPESEAWFGDDVNTYMESLMMTARNVAARAQKDGRVADLSPAALARTLEAETARRLAARDTRKQTRSPERATGAAPAADRMQPVDTLSTRNMNGSGSPLPPATDEKERMRRAAQVVFRNR